MHEEQVERLKDCRSRLNELERCLKIGDAKAQIAALEQQTSAPGFWSEPGSAQKVMQRIKTLKGLIAGPEALARELEDALVLAELAQAEHDESLAEELEALSDRLERELTQLELTSLFTEDRDSKPAIVNIHPGAGGTESCDWAGMLYRMIVRWCERHEYEVELVEYQAGDEAGLKSATLTVKGPYAYGRLKSEEGVHRLVRISPFDANARRHTSFAAVEVLPEADEDVQIEIKEEDIKMDVFRASGPGGQKVNKTSSAVRLTHLPTGIVVACQIERSQYRNRAVAMQLLKSRLYDLEMKKKEEELAAQRETKMEVAWGSQIRSYVLQPYQLVKDHRTEVETGDVEGVLDGDLDRFIEAYLKWNVERKAKQQ